MSKTMAEAFRDSSQYRVNQLGEVVKRVEVTSEVFQASREQLEKDNKAAQAVIWSAINKAPIDKGWKIPPVSLYNNMQPDRNQVSGNGSYQGREYKSLKKIIESAKACNIKIQKKIWVMKHWIALCKLILLVGTSSVGKNTLVCSIAARFSRGGDHHSWPEEENHGWAKVLFFTEEEDVGETSLKLKAAGADLNHVLIFKGFDEIFPHGKFSFTNENDVKKFIAFVESIGNVYLIVFDTIDMVVKDPSNNTHMRHALQKLVRIAERLSCVILGIAHTKKSSSGKDPLNRPAGSRAIVEVPRGVMHVEMIKGGPTEDGATRALVLSKPIGKEVDHCLTFSIVTAMVPGEDGVDVESSKIVWHKKRYGTALENLLWAESGDENNDHAGYTKEAGIKASNFLIKLLTDGPCLKNDILKLAEEEGISYGTLIRTYGKLGIIPTQEPKTKRSIWNLPGSLPVVDQQQ